MHFAVCVQNSRKNIYEMVIFTFFFLSFNYYSLILVIAHMYIHNHAVGFFSVDLKLAFSMSAYYYKCSIRKQRSAIFVLLCNAA